VDEDFYIFYFFHLSHIPLCSLLSKVVGGGGGGGEAKVGNGIGDCFIPIKIKIFTLVTQREKWPTKHNKSSMDVDVTFVCGLIPAIDLEVGTKT